jgi:hypothetical protein
MKIDEITLLKVTLPSKKQMKELDYWNLNRKNRAVLKAAIEKCLQSGEEQSIATILGTLPLQLRKEPNEANG